jgi:hypothetical protein
MKVRGFDDFWADDLDPDFDLGFVSWPIRARPNDGGAVTAGEIGIGPVNHRFVKASPGDTGLQIVAHRLPGHSTEIGEWTVSQLASQSSAVRQETKLPGCRLSSARTPVCTRSRSLEMVIKMLWNEGPQCPRIGDHDRLERARLMVFSGKGGCFPAFCFHP